MTKAIEDPAVDSLSTPTPPTDAEAQETAAELHRLAAETFELPHLRDAAGRRGPH